MPVNEADPNCCRYELDRFTASESKRVSLTGLLACGVGFGAFRLLLVLYLSHSKAYRAYSLRRSCHQLLRRKTLDDKKIPGDFVLLAATFVGWLSLLDKKCA